MQSNSVGYIFGFCAAVCLACSVIVSSAAVGLKERQERNKILDRQKKVLTVAGLMKEGQVLKPSKVKDIFKKRIKSIVVDLGSGQLNKKLKPASFDQHKAAKDPKMSRSAPKNLAGVLRIPRQALVYLVSQKDMDAKGKGFQLSQFIFPVEGKGLWSTLYGFIALAPNFNEIKGLTFYQHAETPGLGGEVDNPDWKKLWPGRLLFGPKGSKFSTWKKPKVEVIKGTAGSAKTNPHKVDGLSGATITSKGVTYLIHFWMGKNGFGPFIKRQLSGNGMKFAKAAPAPRRAAARRAAVRRAVARRAAPARRPVLRAPVAPAKVPNPIRRAAPARPAVPSKPAARPAAPTRPAVPVRPAAVPAKAPARPAAPARRPAAAPAKRAAAPAAPVKRAAAPAPAKPAAPAKRAAAPAAPAKRAAAPAKPRPQARAAERKAAPKARKEGGK